MVTRPCGGGVSPTMTRIVVVLPAPLGPRKPVTRPGWQTKLMSSTAVNVPYFRVSPSTLIMASSLPERGRGRASAHAGRAPVTKVGGGPRPAAPAPTTAVAPSLAAWTERRPRGVPAAAAAVGPRLAARRSCSRSARSAWLPGPATQADIPSCWWSPTWRSAPRAYVLVFFRRRWPVPVARRRSALVSAVSGTAGGPAVLAAVSLATRRRWREIALVGSVGFAGRAVLQHVTSPATATTRLAQPHRQRDRHRGDARLGHVHRLPPRADLDAAATAPSAPRPSRSSGSPRRAANERARIAREMHDVLAHRISQISMHAGALAFREDLTPERDPRQRGGDPGQGARGAHRPARRPRRAARRRTGEPAQRAAADVRRPAPAWSPRPGSRGLRRRVRGPGRAPPTRCRTRPAGRVYRIVQEGITNARKHAPGALLTVRAQRLAGRRPRRAAAQPARLRASAHPGLRAGPGRARRARRAARRPARRTAARASTFVLHGVDTVGGMNPASIGSLHRRRRPAGALGARA